MRGGFTQIPNRFWGMARELKIKPNEGFCLLWLLSHSEGFKKDLSIWKMRTELGMKREVANNVVESLLKKLSKPFAGGLWEDLLPPIPDVVALLESLLVKRAQNSPHSSKKLGVEKSPSLEPEKAGSGAQNHPQIGAQNHLQEYYKEKQREEQKKNSDVLVLHSFSQNHLANIERSGFSKEDAQKIEKWASTPEWLALFPSREALIHELMRLCDWSQRSKKEFTFFFAGECLRKNAQNKQGNKPVSFQIQAKIENSKAVSSVFGLLREIDGETQQSSKMEVF